jgi:hypothetical protein
LVPSAGVKKDSQPSRCLSHALTGGYKKDNRGNLKLVVPNAPKNCLHETDLLDKLKVAQLVKKLFVFYENPKDRYIVIIIHYLTFI